MRVAVKVKGSAMGCNLEHGEVKTGRCVVARLNIQRHKADPDLLPFWVTRLLGQGPDAGLRPLHLVVLVQNVQPSTEAPFHSVSITTPLYSLSQCPFPCICGRKTRFGQELIISIRATICTHNLTWTSQIERKKITPSAHPSVSSGSVGPTAATFRVPFLGDFANYQLDGYHALETNHPLFLGRYRL